MASRIDAVDLVFDGRCGVCTRAARWLLRRDRRGRIHLHPFQRPGVLEEFGLAETEARAAAWAFEAGSAGDRPTRHRGAAAINCALDAAFGVRVFLPVYRLPLIRQAQDRIYRWVAEHRYRLRGTTPWCTRHPEDCGDLADPAGCSLP